MTHIPDGDRQVKPCRIHFATLAAKPNSFKLQPFSRRVLPDQLRLEEGISVQIALRLQFLHQLLKRQVLMRIRPQTHLPNSLQQIPEALSRWRLHSQNQLINEETD